MIGLFAEAFCPWSGDPPPLKWFIAKFGGSCGEEAPAKQVELGAAVHGPLQQLEAVDLPLGLAAAPGQAERGADRGPVLVEAGREALDDPPAAAARFHQPCAEGPTAALLVPADPPRARTMRQNRRPRSTTLAAPSSCGTRATCAAAPASRSSGSRSACHDSCFGEGSGEGRGSGAGASAGGVRRRRIVVLATRVRRSDSRRRTCFTVPGKPNA